MYVVKSEHYKNNSNGLKTFFLSDLEVPWGAGLGTIQYSTIQEGSITIELEIKYLCLVLCIASPLFFWSAKTTFS